MKLVLRGNGCNSCVAFKCDKIRSEFPKFRMSHKYSATEFANMECTGYLCPKEWGVPILMHLATNPAKVQAMNDLLTQFDFQLQERRKYPYFRLRLKKGRK